MTAYKPRERCVARVNLLYSPSYVSNILASPSTSRTVRNNMNDFTTDLFWLMFVVTVKIFGPKRVIRFVDATSSAVLFILFFSLSLFLFYCVGRRGGTRILFFVTIVLIKGRIIWTTRTKSLAVNETSKHSEPKQQELPYLGVRNGIRNTFEKSFNRVRIGKVNIYEWIKPMNK